MTGALAGVLLAGRVHVPVGPFDATLRIGLAWTGDSVVHLAPLGSLVLDTHDGPIRVHVEVDEIRLDEARQYLEDPAELDLLEDRVASDVRGGLVALGLRAALVAIVGGMVLTGLRRATWRAAAEGGAVAVAVLTLSTAVAVVTWRPGAIAQPRYTGALTLAPQAIGNARDVVARFGEYRAQLARLVRNVSRLYEATERLEAFQPEARTVRILHVSDIHLNPGAFDVIAAVVRQFRIDAVVDTGDINDWGTVVEARFTEEIGRLGVPYLFVRGNHDSRATAQVIAAQPNAIVLDGDTTEVAGVTFYGVGDPRFTPDKTSGDDNRGAAFFHLFARRVASDLVDLADLDVRPDVLLLHDPAAVRELAGIGPIRAPLVLAGHAHTRRAEMVDETTLLLVEGSTGGAGLRALEGDEPVPLSMSVLYFDPASRRLQAYDEITVAGLGLSGVTIERHVVAVEDGVGEGGAVENDEDTDTEIDAATTVPE